MSQADERILEVLRDEGNLQPASIANIINDSEGHDYSNSYIQQRCSKLYDAGLLTKYGRGVYSITSLGENFLDGQADIGDELD